jgi:hypothetical protein
MLWSKTVEDSMIAEDRFSLTSLLIQLNKSHPRHQDQLQILDELLTDGVTDEVFAEWLRLNTDK